MYIFIFIYACNIYTYVFWVQRFISSHSIHPTCPTFVPKQVLLRHLSTEAAPPPSDTPLDIATPTEPAPPSRTPFYNPPVPCFRSMSTLSHTLYCILGLRVLPRYPWVTGRGGGVRPVPRPLPTPLSFSSRIPPLQTSPPPTTQPPKDLPLP